MFNLKKKILIVLGLAALIVITSFVSITVYKNYNRKIDIREANKSWNIYDENINDIKANMDSIMEPNENFDWWVLKDFDIKDDDYENALNHLAADIRMCYIGYTDEGEFYTDSNPIRKYRDKKYITKKELETLNFYSKSDSCLNWFNGFFGVKLSDNKELEERLQKHLKNIDLNSKSKLFSYYDQATYNELLMRKINEVQLVKEASDFLVEEYNNLK